MAGWLKDFGKFFTDLNNRNFVLGVVVLLAIFYVLRGETGEEKAHRFFRLVLLGCLLAFVYAAYYFFVKN